MRVTPLYQLNVLHDYFSDGRCKNVEVVPSRETARMLQQYGLFFRQVETTYHIVAKNDGNTPLFVEENLQTSLNFHLKINDPYFLNYTDLPLEISSNQVYYFSNLNAATSFLSKEEKANGQDQLAIKTKQFSYEVDAATHEGKQLQVKNQNGEVVDEYEIKAVQNHILVDLQHQAEGVYDIYIEEELKEKTIISNSATPTDFGFIQLELSTNTWSKERPIKQFIQFKNRATYWQYNIINTHDYQLGNFSVATAPTTIDFSALDSRTLPNGQEAMLLSSAQEIPLQERYTNTLKLNMNKIIGNQIHNIGSSIPLPYPDNKTIKPITQADNTTKIVSDIYVYL